MGKVKYPRLFYRLLVLSSCVLCAALPIAAADFPDPETLYVRQATWPETMLACREHYRQWLDAYTAACPIEAGPWYITEPLKVRDFAHARFPEKSVNLDAKDAKGNPLWQVKTDYRDGAVHALPGGDAVTTYLYRTITAARDLEVGASVGSDDGIAVWLNGENLLAKDVPRVAAPDQDRVALRLKAGENALLLKIYNRTGGHGFYFSLREDHAGALVRSIAADYPREAGWLAQDVPGASPISWFEDGGGTVAFEESIIQSALDKAGAPGPLADELAALKAANTPRTDRAWLDLYRRARIFCDGQGELESVNMAALRRAVVDLSQNLNAGQYDGTRYLATIAEAERQLPELRAALARGEEEGLQQAEALVAALREPLLANPLLNFDSFLLIKRGEGNLGLPQNWQGNCAMSSHGYDNEIAVLSLANLDAELRTLYRPEHAAFVGDVDLHFDADRMLFSMPGSHGRWQIWEIQADGAGLRQVTPGEEPDVDNYDACYLPDGRIIFASTRCFQGVPCVGGSNTVANLCLMNVDGTGIRQLCFDQDHNWCPTLLNNGRVLFSRWEYSDTPHYFSRLLFNMNPDGTEQMAYYGSNSFWPNSTFYARPIPGHPTEVVAIVSGHHGVPRMGELILFDPAKGRHEADGVVQRIPGYGEAVAPVIVDQLVDGSWPKFLHPYPLSDKYFLVSSKPSPSALWGIYLVDIFDNRTLLKEMPGYALFEPMPFRPTVPPPVIPDKVKPGRDDAVVYLVDVYAGQGLAGVPKGTVKKLRLYEFYYAYPNMGGHINIGVEGPWDVHRILGTVPVYDDGSALFRVPADMPIAVQPLDADGRALQVMRSWFAAMPGETLSCVGCHERQNMAPTPRQTLAGRRAPAEITPWYGPARGFSFKREVQPVLDAYCVRCHDGRESERGPLPDFRRKDKNGWSNFTPSYLALHPYVRRPGPESSYHLSVPLDWHASTSELVQMLEKNHKGVVLGAEAWDRLVTWIDLNVPDHGTWAENAPIPKDFHERRLEMRARYANRPEDPEFIPDISVVLSAEGPAGAEAILPAAGPPPEVEGWPFDEARAKQRQQASGPALGDTIDLGEGVTIELALIPGGSFVMGDAAGASDERPPCEAHIDAPFWMGATEVTLRQYALFDPKHQNGFLDQHHKDHTLPGYAADGPDEPVIRVSWDEAMAFCDWLSARTGRQFSLPTEAQWEWACRAGTATPLNYGGLDTDFAAYANMADVSIKLLAVSGINPQPIPNPNPYEDFLPKDPRFDDGEKLMANVGKYLPNAWDLKDTHGNVAEWTRTAYRPYPYAEDDGRNALDTPGKRVVRGGSWRDRPKRCRSTFRLAYPPWQKVFDVGFRVVCEAQPGPGATHLAAHTE